MIHYTILKPRAAVMLLLENEDFRTAVGKSLSQQIIRSFESIATTNSDYDPSVETMLRMTEIAMQVLKLPPPLEDLDDVVRVIAPSEIATWLNAHPDTYFDITRAIGCSRTAVYHYRKTGYKSMPFSIVAGLSDYIHAYEQNAE